MKEFFIHFDECEVIEWYFFVWKSFDQMESKKERIDQICLINMIECLTIIWEYSDIEVLVDLQYFQCVWVQIVITFTFCNIFFVQYNLSGRNHLYKYKG